MQTVNYQLRQVGSTDQGSNPDPLPWEHGVSAARPPGRFSRNVYHLQPPHRVREFRGRVFWGQKIFNLGFEEIEGAEAQVQGLLVRTSCFRFAGKGSLSPKAVGCRQEHSGCSRTQPGQPSGRRSQVPATLLGLSVPRHLRRGTSPPSCPDGSFLPPPSVGTGWGEGVRAAFVFGAFIWREQVGLCIYMGQGMEPGSSPHQSWSAR